MSRGSVFILCWIMIGTCFPLTLQAQSPFASSRVIHFSSPTYPATHMFEILFSHRFSQPFGDATLNDLFGLDSFAYTGFGLGYGLTSRLSLRVYRTSFEKNFEFSTRYVIYDSGQYHMQTRLIWNWNTDKNVDDPLRVGVQTILGFEVGRVALAVLPSWVRKPSRNPEDTGYTIGLPIQLGLRLSSTFSFVGEVAPVVAGFRRKTQSGSFSPSWGVGLHISIGDGGHVFTLLVTNQIGTTFDQVLPGSQTSKLRLGFNLLRRI